MSRKKQAELKKMAAPFAKSDTKASIYQLINTIVPFLVIWFLAYKSLSISFMLAIPLILLASGFVVRIFIIFHDCTHQSFFKGSQANRIVGTITGIITLFPFEKWKRNHAIHHATSGNLDKRGTGDVWVMTVEEYLNASFWKKTAYRLYRNPIVMFGFGPLYLYLVSNRFNRPGARRKERINTYVINVSVLFIYTALMLLIGWQAFLMIQLPIMFIAGSLGIWLFYVQHQFEDSYFENEDEWSFVKAAVDGSSYYKLPKLLQWLTGSIGFHHVHHLSPRVPNYHLEKVHESTPPLKEATTITLLSSLKALRFRLYDEDHKTFVSFQEVKTIIKRKHLQSKLQKRITALQEK